MSFCHGFSFQGSRVKNAFFKVLNSYDSIAYEAKAEQWMNLGVFSRLECQKKAPFHRSI